MNILKKLGGAVKKTVKKVKKAAAPVQKLAKSDLAQQLGANDALLGAQLDMAGGDFGNLKNRLAQVQQQAQMAAAYESGGMIPPGEGANQYLQFLNANQSQQSSGMPSNNQFDINSLIGQQSGFQSAPWEQNSQSDLLKQVLGGMGKDLDLQKVTNNLPNLNDLASQMGGYFKGDLDTQRVVGDENIGFQEASIPEEVDNSTPWYKRLGSWVGDKASKRYADIKGALGSEAAKPYLAGAMQLGGGLASNLYTDKSMRDYISAVNEGQNLDYRLQGPSAMEDLTGTEEFARMQQYARGGMSPEEELARQESLRRQNQNLQANNQAIAESAARRGMRGGNELAQQMLQGQEASNRMSLDEQNLRAQMFNRAQNATGNILNQRSAIAQAHDVQRSADANRMTQQALYRQQAKERSSELGAARKSGQGQILASTGNTFANVLNPPKQTQQNPMMTFNIQHQQPQQSGETEEQRKKRLGQV